MRCHAGGEVFERDLGARSARWLAVRDRLDRHVLDTTGVRAGKLTSMRVTVTLDPRRRVCQHLATRPTTVATGIRTPRIHRTPFICAGLTVIRSKGMAWSLVLVPSVYNSHSKAVVHKLSRCLVALSCADE